MPAADKRRFGQHAAVQQVYLSSVFKAPVGCSIPSGDVKLPPARSDRTWGILGARGGILEADCRGVVNGRAREAGAGVIGGPKNPPIRLRFR